MKEEGRVKESRWVTKKETIRVGKRTLPSPDLLLELLLLRSHEGKCLAAQLRCVYNCVKKRFSEWVQALGGKEREDRGGRGEPKQNGPFPWGRMRRFRPL